MPTTRRSAQLAAAPERVWEAVSDPYHLPRWWPKATRVEAVEPEAWTLVMTSSRGGHVRADYELLHSEPMQRRSWALRVEGTPFERVFDAQTTEVSLEPSDGGTRVTLALVQEMHGMSRLGGVMVRRAAGRILSEALAGLERAVS